MIEVFIWLLKIIYYIGLAFSISIIFDYCMKLKGNMLVSLACSVILGILWPVLVPLAYMQLKRREHVLREDEISRG